MENKDLKGLVKKAIEEKGVYEKVDWQKVELVKKINLAERRM